MLDKPTNYKRLEEFERHLFWKTTLINAEFWTYNDNGTTRVVDAFTEKVLAETTLLTLEHVRQALKFATTVL